MSSWGRREGAFLAFLIVAMCLGCREAPPPEPPRDTLWAKVDRGDDWNEPGDTFVGTIEMPSGRVIECVAIENVYALTIHCDEVEP